MRIITLMYHDIILSHYEISGFTDNGSSLYKIQASDFESQIKTIAECYLNSSDYNVRIILSFDDGGVSLYSNVAPILEKYNLKGYFFIPTAYIGLPGFLTEIQIVNLYHRGHIIGTHSHTHPRNISILSSKAIESDWMESIKILKRILPVNKIEYASIPNGYFDRHSKKILFENGIKYIFTSKPCFNNLKFNECHSIIGRFAIKNGMSLDQLMNILNHKTIQILTFRLKWILSNILKNILGSHYRNIREFILLKSEHFKTTNHD